MMWLMKKKIDTFQEWDNFAVASNAKLYSGLKIVYQSINFIGY